MAFSFSYDDPYMCQVCRGAGNSWDTLVCESCWRNVHMEPCSGPVWVVRDNEEACHWLCVWCSHEDECE